MSFVLRNLVSQLKLATNVSVFNEVRCLQARSKKKMASTYDYLIHPRPRDGVHLNFRRKIHYEDDYTVKPLNVSNLAGRDIHTGRVVVNCLGGGIKHKYHWIQWVRKGPTSADEPPVEEEVIDIIFDGNRSAKVALVAGGDEMKYYLAADQMKPGDVIKTSSYIPPLPLQNPNIGDAYPLGALTVGTIVHNVERLPGQGSRMLHSAGAGASIVKKIGNKVYLKMPSKHEVVCDENCMAVVGRVSNVEHSSIPIGSPNRLRELGFRPRSGLWQRKDGRFGRKIRPPRTFVNEVKPLKSRILNLDACRVPKLTC